VGPFLIGGGKDGDPFLNDKDLKTAKHSGKAYLKVNDAYTPTNVAGLPTPFDLTKDKKWDESGELLLKYDLELEGNLRGIKVFSGVKEVFSTTLNTSGDEEPINNIQDSGFEETGVKVFSLFREGDRENIECGGEQEEQSDSSISARDKGLLWTEQLADIIF